MKLKRSIPKDTEIKDLYNDGNYYYKIKAKDKWIWYPVDFNDFKHPDFIILQEKEAI